MTGFALNRINPEIIELVKNSTHKTLAVWAGDCAEHVLKQFDIADERPANAIAMCRAWVKDEISMLEARRYAFAAHAAAREMKDKAHCKIARSCGHAAATTHVPGHAIYAAAYALSAIDNSVLKDRERLIEQERDWQYRHLLELQKR